MTPLSLEDALAMVEGKGAKLLVNSRTGRGAVQRRARSVTDDDGAVHPRLRLVWPLSDSVVPAETLLASQWEAADRDTFSADWRADQIGRESSRDGVCQNV